MDRESSWMVQRVAQKPTANEIVSSNHPLQERRELGPFLHYTIACLFDSNEHGLLGMMRWDEHFGEQNVYQDQASIALFSKISLFCGGTLVHVTQKWVWRYTWNLPYQRQRCYWRVVDYFCLDLHWGRALLFMAVEFEFAYNPESMNKKVLY